MSLNSNSFTLDVKDSLLFDYGVYYLEIHFMYKNNSYSIRELSVYGSSKMLSYEPCGGLARKRVKVYNIICHVISLDDSVCINSKYLFQNNYRFELSDDGLEHKLVSFNRVERNAGVISSLSDKYVSTSYVDSHLKLVSSGDECERLCLLYTITVGMSSISDSLPLEYEDNIHYYVSTSLLTLFKILYICSNLETNLNLTIKFNSDISLNLYLNELIRYIYKYSSYTSKCCDLSIVSEDFVDTATSSTSGIVYPVGGMGVGVDSIKDVILQSLSSSFRSVNYSLS
jgi:hypothetical protein